MTARRGHVPFLPRWILPSHIAFLFAAATELDEIRSSALMSEDQVTVTAEDTILDVKQLTIRFGPATVLKDVSFRVVRGESVAVIGPNGSGKTVLFRALIGA